jgi:hypothetical protein
MGWYCWWSAHRALVDYWVFPPKSGSEPLGFYSVSIGSPLEMTLITWMTPWRSAVLRTYPAEWLSKLYTMMTVPQKNHQHIADWMAMYNRQNSHLKKPPPKLFALSPATSMILNRRQVLWSFVLVMVGLCQNWGVDAKSNCLHRYSMIWQTNGFLSEMIYTWLNCAYLS